MEDMQSDDRVLVAYVPRPSDFDIVVKQRWYRIPLRHAPKGVHAEWLAFYFGRAFDRLKYAVHYCAPLRGHELSTRRELLPAEGDHPRADDIYYKLQIGPLHRLARPIVSLRWRRVLFIHTTGDRFRAASEINDLLIQGDQFVDRAFVSLREQVETPYVVPGEG